MLCPLCDLNPKDIIWENSSIRIIDARQDDIPGYIRIVAKRHLAEMTDFSKAEQLEIWKYVALSEEVMRKTMHPKKVNLAEFGNMVPHLHWHIIPRYVDDPWFPECTWAPKVRDVPRETVKERQLLASRFFDELRNTLDGQKSSSLPLD